MIWHYTKGAHIEAIVFSRVILPAEEMIDRGERPAVWLSTSDEWEPTVWFPEFNDGRELPPGGRARIGVADDYPLTWLDFVKQSGIRQKTARKLLRSAQACRAPVDCWRVSFDPIPIERWTAIERWNERFGVWLPHEAWTERVAA